MIYSSKIKELRSFLILWGSQAVSSFGTAMTNFSLIIWDYKQQGTVSSIKLCSYLPSILFCFLAGTLADRKILRGFSIELVGVIR